MKVPVTIVVIVVHLGCRPLWRCWAKSFPVQRQMVVASIGEDGGDVGVGLVLVAKCRGKWSEFRFQVCRNRIYEHFTSIYDNR